MQLLRPLAAALLLAAAPLPGAETRVETLDLRETMQSDWSVPQAGQAGGRVGGPLRVGGQTSAAGFGTVGGSRLELALDGRAERFRARTGVDETSGWLTTVRFLLVGDGRVLYRGPWQQRGGPAVGVDVPLAGLRRLVLVADVRGDPHARADWREPVVTHAGAAPEAGAGADEAVKPPPVKQPPPPPSPESPPLNRPSPMGRPAAGGGDAPLGPGPARAEPAAVAGPDSSEPVVVVAAVASASAAAWQGRCGVVCVCE